MTFGAPDRKVPGDAFAATIPPERRVDEHSGSGPDRSDATRIRPILKDSGSQAWHPLIALSPIVVVLVVGTSTAFFQLGVKGLWGDEVWQVSWSQQQPWLETFLRFRAPPDLPLSFLLTKLATSLGETPFWVRLPSALAAVASVIVTFIFARGLFGVRTGFLAALLLAVAPFHVWYAQDGRGYAALSFYALLSLFFFWRLLHRPTIGTGLGFLTATILSLYNHLFGIFPIVVELVVFGVWAPLAWLRAFRNPDPHSHSRVLRVVMWILATTAVALVASAPLHAGVTSYLVQGGPGEVEAAPFVPTAQFIEDLFGRLTAGTGPTFWVVITLFVLGTFGAAHRRNWFPLLALAWLAIPVIALWIAQPRHIFIPRYFLFMQPVLLIVVAHGIVVGSGIGGSLFASLRGRSPADLWSHAGRLLPLGLPIAALAIFSVPTLSSYWVEKGTDWSGMCSYMKRVAEPGDMVIGNAYHQGVMEWCLADTPALSVAPTGSYSLASLSTSGRGVYYVHLPPEPPDPALLRYGYNEVPRADWATSVSQSGDATFPFPIGEYTARLFRSAEAQLPRRITFHEVDGATISPNWPDYAHLGVDRRYLVRLSLPADRPRVLDLLYLDADERDLDVVVDGNVIARLIGGTGNGGWITATLRIPQSSGDEVLVEFRNAGSDLVAFSMVELRYADDETEPVESGEARHTEN